MENLFPKPIRKHKWMCSTQGVDAVVLQNEAFMTRTAGNTDETTQQQWLTYPYIPKWYIKNDDLSCPFLKKKKKSDIYHFKIKEKKKKE